MQVGLQLLYPGSLCVDMPEACNDCQILSDLSCDMLSAPDIRHVAWQRRTPVCKLSPRHQMRLACGTGTFLP